MAASGAVDALLKAFSGSLTNFLRAGLDAVLLARGELTVGVEHPLLMEIGVEAFTAAVVAAAVVVAALDVRGEDVFALDDDDDEDADDEDVFAAISLLSFSNMSKMNFSKCLPPTPIRMAD